MCTDFHSINDISLMLITFALLYLESLCFQAPVQLRLVNHELTDPGFESRYIHLFLASKDCRLSTQLHLTNPALKHV